MKLLSLPEANHKTRKLSEKYGISVYTLQLLPRNMAFEDEEEIENVLGLKTFCPCATDDCFKTCLVFTGRAGWTPEKDPRNKIMIVRKRRSHLLLSDPVFFMEQLEGEIRTYRRRCIIRGIIPVFRLNCFSDIPWEKICILGGESIMERYSDVKFYDYTKIISRDVPENYHLTFSRSGENDKECIKALRKGWNVAVVFRSVLPDKYWGRRVIDGDKHDFRFLDNLEAGQSSPLIVGLKFKGRRKNESSFVV